MRRVGLVALLVIGLFFGGVAYGHGPSGSSEDEDPNGGYSNEVTCGSGTTVPMTTTVVYAGTNGVEACDQNSQNAQGRIIVSIEGQYIAADGDQSNGESTRGYIRVDSSGVTCADEAGRRDSTHPEGDATTAECAPGS